MRKTVIGVARTASFSVREASALVLENASRYAKALRAAASAAQIQNGAAGLPAEPPAGQQWKPHEIESLFGKHAWQPHEYEILVQSARELPRGAKPPLDRMLQLLGWDHIPDPGKKLRNKVTCKFSAVRAMIDNGVDPLQVGVKKKRIRSGATTWMAWIRRAFKSLPDGQGTLDDVCAVLETDPDVAPLLDQRPHAEMRTIPIWRVSVNHGLKKLPGVIKTGGKRGGLTVYSYNPQDAVAAAVGGGKGGRASKRGQPGLPFMGKKSKNAN